MAANWATTALLVALHSLSAWGTWGVALTNAVTGRARRALPDPFDHSFDNRHHPQQLRLKPPNRLLLTSATQKAQSSNSNSSRPFLIPLLPYGLSNQVLALKETLALAHVLNWTVVTFGFWPHRSELPPAAQWIENASVITRRRMAAGAAAANSCSLGGARPGAEHSVVEPTQAGLARGIPARLADGTALRERVQRGRSLREKPAEPLTIPFDVIFNRSNLEPIVRVITYEEAVQHYGWPEGGPLDAVVALRPSGLDMTLGKAIAAGLLDLRGLEITHLRDFSCAPEGLTALSTAVEGRRWVALYSYREVVPLGRSTYRDLSGDPDPCARAFQLMSRNLVKSALVADTARDFVDAFSLGATAMKPPPPPGRAGARALGPYVIGVHVRPYPDTCLSYFINMTDFDLSAAEKVCMNPKNLINIVGWLRRLLAARAALIAADGVCSETGERGMGQRRRLPSTALDAASSGRVVVFVMTHPHVRDVVRREMRRLWKASPLLPLVHASTPASVGSKSTVTSRMVALDSGRYNGKAARKIGTRATGRRRGVPGSSGTANASGSRSNSSTRRAVSGTGAVQALSVIPSASSALLPDLRTRRPNSQVMQPASSAGAAIAAAPGVNNPVTRGLRAQTNTVRADVSGAGGGGAVADGGRSLRLPRLYFLDVPDLPAPLRQHIASNSLLSMVEQQVCRTANVFIGSRASSISVVVAQERTAADPEAPAKAAAALSRLEAEGEASVTGSVPCDLAAALEHATLLV